MILLEKLIEKCYYIGVGLKNRKRGNIMAKMQRTNLVWDEYIDYLINAIENSSIFRKMADNPMMIVRTDRENDVSSRLSHSIESARIAKKIAKGLGLNEKFIYAAMLLHDIGHTFSGHEGEVIFNQLGELFNIQSFHHNSNGINIVQYEDICGKAINSIPNIDSNPELKKQLEEEFYYFLDVIISHDGEATIQDMIRPETPYPTIREAVETKERLANSQNQYKFIAQTPEGKLAKYADVFAYMSSDIRDRF